MAHSTKKRNFWLPKRHPPEKAKLRIRDWVAIVFACLACGLVSVAIEDGFRGPLIMWVHFSTF